jgi:VanZ like family
MTAESGDFFFWTTNLLRKMSSEKESNSFLLLLLTIAIVSGILFYGLRPKAFSLQNNIQWLPETKALRLQSPSLAYLNDFGCLRDQKFDGFTLVMNIKAASVDIEGFKPIIMIHDGDDQRQFSFWQWKSSIVAMDGDDYDYKRKTPRLSALDILKKGKNAELVLTSGPAGTSLFLDGRLIKEQRDLRLLLPSADKKIRLILGNSVYSKHNWTGDISLLAIYGKPFSASEVILRHDHWAETANLSTADREKLLLLYTFDKIEGRVVRDQSGRGYDLHIPRAQVVLKKSFLALPWKNFTFNRWFINDVALNVFGFIPLGAVFFAWVLLLKASSRKTAGGLVLAACFLLSLAIEIAQAWMPNRTSSLLDVALNTLGALIGIVLVFLVFQYRCRQINREA